jgi:hypothetical protein
MLLERGGLRWANDGNVVRIQADRSRTGQTRELGTNGCRDTRQPLPSAATNFPSRSVPVSPADLPGLPELRPDAGGVQH